MPYGEKVTQNPDATYEYINFYPGGEQRFSTVLTGQHRVVHSISRTGGNAASKLSNVIKTKAPKVYEKRLVTVLKGPKLSTLYFDKKYMRFRRARAPIKVWRMVRVWSKSLPKKKRKGLDLPPNSLNFSESKVQGDMFNSSVSASYPGLPEWKRQFTGQLIHYPMIGPSTGASSFSLLELSSYPITSFDRSGLYEAAEVQANAASINKLAEKAKNQSANFAQFFAERRQTASLIAETAVRLAKVLALMKKGNVSQAAKTLFPSNSKQLANDVLAWNFGVKPLLSDIDGMMKHLAQGDGPLIIDIIASNRVDIPFQSFSETITRPIRCTTELTQYGYVEVRRKMRLKVSLPFIHKLSEMGFGNPLSVGWELLPWSFVVDWFIPVGNYINALDAFDGFSIVHGHKTVFRKRYSELTRNYGGLSADGYVCDFKKVSAKAEQTECTRSLISTFPTIQLPSFKDPLSVSHLVNAMALSRQLIR